jgi:hypothetical protein
MAGVIASNLADFTIAGVVEVNLDNANDDVLIYGNDGSTNRAIRTDGLGRLITACSTPTKSNVAASASSVTLLAANANRRGLSFYNDSSSNLYVDSSGGTASTSSFSFLMLPFSYFEAPQPVHTSAITGIWTTATGTLRVTEFT